MAPELVGRWYDGDDSYVLVEEGSLHEYEIAKEAAVLPSGEVPPGSIVKLSCDQDKVIVHLLSPNLAPPRSADITVSDWHFQGPGPEDGQPPEH